MLAVFRGGLNIVGEVDTVGGPDIRFVGVIKQSKDGIFEIRTKLGSDITRVLYFFFAGEKAVLTNGFVKKTQKTPRKELDKARSYRDDYLKRGGSIV